MRICFLIPGLRGGGAEFVAREWATWFSNQGHEVTVLTTIRGSRPPAEPNFAIVELEGSSIVQHTRSLRRYLADERVDTLVALLPYYNIMAIAATRVMKNRPTVLISGRNVEVPFPEVHGPRYRSTRLIAKILYPRCDGYIAISHPVAAEACALYKIDSSRTFVVPNPAVAKVMRSHAEQDGRYNTSEEQVLNLIVPARIVAQKRPLVALETARIVESRQMYVKVHYFGVGGLEPEVAKRADELGIEVKFHGWDENWFRELPPNSIVLLTSLVEGFGNVLVEAAAVGVPSVVSSRCLGSADAVVPGITGALAMSDTPKHYAEAVLRASECDMVGAIKWTQRFSPESSGRALLNAIEETQAAGIHA